MKVLYATDGFDASIAARRLIEELFQRDGTTVTVVSVAPRGSIDPGHLMLELDPIEQRREDTQQLVGYAAAALSAAGFATNEQVLEGHPGRKLLDEISTNSYDVVVVGSGSHNWAGHRLLGSVSTLILHESPTSVLVAHEMQETDDVAEALVAVDGSETANRTIELASRLLDPRRVQVNVLSVAETMLPVGIPVVVGPTMPSQETIQTIELREEELAQRHATSVAQQLQGADFQVASGTRRGWAAAVILEEARQERADLVVVGSRGIGPLRRALLGSVSDQVARLAPATLVGRFPKDAQR